MDYDPSSVSPSLPTLESPSPERTVRIRPLRCECLVRLLPQNYCPGEIILPDVETKGEKAGASRALVVAIGQWKKTRQGLSILPDFMVGQVVIVSKYLGISLREIKTDLKLVHVDDVLAVETHEIKSPSEP